MKVTESGIPIWKENISKLSNDIYQTHVIFKHESNDRDTDYIKIWYRESRQYLIDNGITTLTENAKNKNNTCEYHKLFWNENIFKNEMTINPVLLTSKKLDDYNLEVVLWSTNKIKNMSFRGFRLTNVSRWSETIYYVIPEYSGIINKNKLRCFLNGIHVPEPKPKKYKLNGKLTTEFFEDQVIKNNIKKCRIHNCSYCDYETGFLFFNENNKIKVYYDNGCYCLRNHSRDSSMEELIDLIHLQSSEKGINKFKKFWNIPYDIIEI